MSALLFEPLAIGSVTVPNRIAVPPMCQCRADGGLPGAWHTMHYGKLAASGAGLVVVEATAVAPEGRITTRCLGLWSDAHERALAELVRSCKSVAPDTKLFIQLSHAGRKGSRRDPAFGRGTLSPGEGGFELMAPSRSAFEPGAPEAREMTADDIAATVAAFAEAARRAECAGFDGIQLHAAHGYLLHQFLSPLANRRTDAYGGSFANRTRFVLEVLRAVSAACSLPVTMRLSAGDCIEGGWTMDDAVAFLKLAEREGLAAADVSIGGLSPRQNPPVLTVALQAGNARRIKSETGLVVYAVGNITAPLQAEAVLAAGDADGIGIGREMIRNPNWGWNAAQVLNVVVQMPPAYWPAF